MSAFCNSLHFTLSLEVNFWTELFSENLNALRKGLVQDLCLSGLEESNNKSKTSLIRHRQKYFTNKEEQYKGKLPPPKKKKKKKMKILYLCVLCFLYRYYVGDVLISLSTVLYEY